MEKSWKTAAMGAIAGFTVSVFFGILGGVGFGTLLVRAIMGAAFFSGLGTGAFFLSRRFLPELFSDDTPAPEAIVDISLPSLNPHEVPLEPSVEDERVSDGESPEIAEDEPEDLLPEDIDGMDPGVDPVMAIRSGTTASLDPVSMPETGGEAAAEKESGSFQALDTLPDLGSLETSFSSPLRETTLGAGGKSEEKDPDKDPVLLAKVVQTLLRKEKEG